MKKQIIFVLAVLSTTTVFASETKVLSTADSLVSRVDALELKVEKLSTLVSSSGGWSCQATCYADSASTQVFSDGSNAKQSLQRLWLECESFMHEISAKSWNIGSSSSVSGTYKGSLKNDCIKN